MKVKDTFNGLGLAFVAVKGSAAAKAPTGSTKLHIPNYELAPLCPPEYDDEDDDDSCAAAVLPSLGA